MPANYSHHPAKLLAILVGLALVGAIVVVASMQSGLPDIRNDDPSYQTVAPQTSTAGPVNSVDDDRTAGEDIACFTSAEDSALTGCDFDPNKRYDYVGTGGGQGGAWVAVPDDYVYDNGNRPPTGAELASR